MISSSFLQEFRVFSYVSYNYHASLLHLSSFSPGCLKGRSGVINVPGSIRFSVVLQLPAPLGFCVHDVVPQKQAICAGFCDLPQHCWMETRAEFKSFPSTCPPIAPDCTWPCWFMIAFGIPRSFSVLMFLIPTYFLQGWFRGRSSMIRSGLSSC